MPAAASHDEAEILSSSDLLSSPERRSSPSRLATSSPPRSSPSARDLHANHHGGDEVIVLSSSPPPPMPPPSEPEVIDLDDDDPPSEAMDECDDDGNDDDDDDDGASDDHDDHDSSHGDDDTKTTTNHSDDDNDADDGDGDRDDDDDDVAKDDEEESDALDIHPPALGPSAPLAAVGLDPLFQTFAYLFIGSLLNDVQLDPRLPIDDGSGCIPCIRWASDYRVRTRLSRLLPLGTVVQVTGQLMLYHQQGRAVSVFRIVRCRDPQDEVVHWAQTYRLTTRVYAKPLRHSNGRPVTKADMRAVIRQAKRQTASTLWDAPVPFASCDDAAVAVFQAAWRDAAATNGPAHLDGEGDGNGDGSALLGDPKLDADKKEREDDYDDDDDDDDDDSLASHYPVPMDDANASEADDTSDDEAQQARAAEKAARLETLHQQLLRRYGRTPFRPGDVIRDPGLRSLVAEPQSDGSG
ncbi:hypothetical protein CAUPRSCDRAFT_11879, partial [Caulochytrium protostelioides]